MKKQLSFLLCFLLATSALSTFSACGNNKNVLRVSNWAEYIDGGDEDSELIHECESWYEEQT